MLYLTNVMFMKATASTCGIVDKNLDSGIRLPVTLYLLCLSFLIFKREIMTLTSKIWKNVWYLSGIQQMLPKCSLLLF